MSAGSLTVADKNFAYMQMIRKLLCHAKAIRRHLRGGDVQLMQIEAFGRDLFTVPSLGMSAA